MTRTAGELANFLGATLVGEPHVSISGVASPESACETDVIYVDAPKFALRAKSSAARCAIAHAGVQIAGKTILEMRDPKLAFAKAASWLLPRSRPSPGFHPTAVVSSTARVANDIHVGPYVVIEDDVEIGGGSVIEAFCFLGRGGRVGENSWLHPRVTLYPGARLGDEVEIHSGAVIGSDGFGYVFGEGKHWKFPQLGGVEIEKGVEIGANTTIDRGSLETTRIREGAKIDNLVQIAHNVEIGPQTVIAAQTGISGSSKLGERVIIGGQVGIADHCTLEDDAIAGAQAGIPSGKTIRHGQMVWGTPARPIEKFKHQYGWFSRLPELAERVRKLEEEKGSK
jgi:UDP-3-O-[3-hydroxymyristoyl] glucosamine N-acyltransferase